MPASRKKPTAPSARPATTAGRAPRRSRMRPPIWASDHEAEEEVQDVEAGLRRALAERDLRVHAGEEEERDEHDRHQPEHQRSRSRTPRSRKICRRSSGYGDAQLPEHEPDHQRRADHDAGPRRDAAPAPHAPTAGSPSTSRPIAAGDEHGAAVVELRRVRARRPACERQIRNSAMSATGMLIQKIERQVHCVRKPPAIGPIAVRPPEMPKKIAIAWPRSRSGNDATTMPTAAGNISAADAPWRTRKMMIQVSAIAPVGRERRTAPTRPRSRSRRSPPSAGARARRRACRRTRTAPTAPAGSR